ncbi:glycosyltransferase, partial [Micrococcus sp. SIMBA_131]
VRFPLNTMYGFWGKVSQMLLYTFVIPKVIFMMWKIKPDVIHVHYPVTSYLAKIYGKITGRKFLTTHHISGIPKHPLHKKADAVIAI